MDMLAQGWQRWTQPHSSITDIEQRRQAQWLAGITLVCIVVAAISGVFNIPALLSGRRDLANAFVGIGTPIIYCALTYALNRFGFYRIAALLLIGTLFVRANTHVVDPDSSPIYIFYNSLVLILASIFFGWRGTLATAAVCMLAILLFAGNIQHSATFATNSFTAYTLVVALFVIASYFFRADVERARRAELQAANAALRDSEASLERRVAERTRELEQARSELEKLYAEQVAVAEQLREVDNLKSRFLASMSHELRTPLNAILNFTKFVAAGVTGPVNEKQVDALNKTISSGKHLLSLINDVLDITKIESGMLTLFVEAEVNLNDELDGLAATGETLLAEKPEVSIVREFDMRLPSITGDKRRIRQILLNLISNACKFTEKGSVTLGAKVQDDMLLCWVRDTGPGIAPDEQADLFESFRQTKVGLSQGGGTGLGLAIAKRLAEAHEGRLWVESTVGEGATFYVTLPIASEKLKSQILVPQGVA